MKTESNIFSAKLTSFIPDDMEVLKPSLTILNIHSKKYFIVLKTYKNVLFKGFLAEYKVELIDKNKKIYNLKEIWCSQTFTYLYEAIGSTYSYYKKTFEN